MSVFRLSVRQKLGWMAFTLLMGCAATFTNHGYAPTDSDLEEILVGVDTRDSVEETVGRPSSTGILKESGWYYLSNKMRHYAYRAPVAIDRQLVAITFDKRGVVKNIERFTLEDGQVVVLTRRVTKTGIKGVSFIRQMLGNIGRANLEDSL